MTRSPMSEAMTKPRVPAAKEGLPSERTASETTALLVELGRAVKARSFYAATEPEVRLLFSRAWRSVAGWVAYGYRPWAPHGCPPGRSAEVSLG